MSTRNVPDLVRSGIERDGRYTAEEVIEGLKSGRFQLFAYPQGILITQITGHNRLLVFLVSGEDFDLWKVQANEDLRAFAHARGIDVIEAYCRRGLEPKLKELGWQTEQIVMRLRTKTRKGEQCQETYSEPDR